MNLGAFAVVAALQRRRGVTSSIDTFAGLGRREPALAILMTLFLLSLTGIPPTAGFFAKAYVILAGVEAGGPAGVLAVIAVLNAAVAAFYYLRVVVYMFMRDAEGRAGRASRRAASCGPGSAGAAVPDRRHRAVPGAARARRSSSAANGRWSPEPGRLSATASARRPASRRGCRSADPAGGRGRGGMPLATSTAADAGEPAGDPDAGRPTRPARWRATAR